MTTEVVVNASPSLSDDPEQMWPVDSLEFCCYVQPCHPMEDAGRLSVSYESQQDADLLKDMRLKISSLIRMEFGCHPKPTVELRH